MTRSGDKDSDRPEPTASGSRVTYIPLGVSKSEWDKFKQDRLSSPEKRAVTQQAWLEYEEKRKKRWEEAGFDLDWSDIER